MFVLGGIVPGWGESRVGVINGELGVFFPEADTLRLVERLRDTESLTEQVRILEAEAQAQREALQAAQAEVTHLREALDAAKLAAAKGQWIDESFQRIVDRYEAVITRLDKRVESLERQRLWMTVLGPVGLLIGLFFH